MKFTLSIFVTLILWMLVITMTGCRTDKPPQIMLCIADGLGGADCDVPGVGKKYLLPSQTANFWMTDQDSMAKMMSWCYDANPHEMEMLLERHKRIIKTRPYEDMPQEIELEEESEPLQVMLKRK